MGKKRNNNQDRISVNNNQLNIDVENKFSLNGTMEDNKIRFAVFDGMGGEDCGEKASGIAVDVFEDNPVDSDISLEEMCININEAICDYMESYDINRMGSTAAMIEISEKKMEICNIGDSKIFRISDGKMQQLSVDHSMIINKSSKRRALTQHLGIPKEEMLIEPYCDEVTKSKDDIFLICSDGLTDMIYEDEISAVVTENPISASAEILYNKAMENGGKDNISVIVFRIKE